MKWIMCGVFLFLIVVCAGCTTVNTATPAAAVSPNLIGNWSGSMKGYLEGQGYMEVPHSGQTLVITEQKDRLFSGQMIFVLKNSSTRTEGFAGVIGPDKKSLKIVEYGSGHCDGSIVSNNEIELIYIDDAEPSRIAINSLKRVL